MLMIPKTAPNREGGQQTVFHANRLTWAFSHHRRTFVPIWRHLLRISDTRCLLRAMGHTQDAQRQPGLYWSDLAAAVMSENGVCNRGQLATKLEPLVARQAVYRGFTEGWRGRVSEQLLLAMVASFATPHCEHCGLPRLIQFNQPRR